MRRGHLIDLYPIIVVNFQNDISLKNISLLFDDQYAFLFFSLKRFHDFLTLRTNGAHLSLHLGNHNYICQSNYEKARKVNCIRK